MSRRWWTLAGLGLGVLAGGLVLMAGCRGGGTTAKRSPQPAGYPARGQLIDDRVLDDELPPPPRDAVAYDILHPLRNGRAVAEKKRWIWIPDGTRMTAAESRERQISLSLPKGAKLWKEFYLGTAGGPRLVERRLLLKLDDSDSRNGWLLNGGWRMYTAHYLPSSADGVSGFENRLAVSAAALEPWIYKPEQWMPTRVKAAATFVGFPGSDGKPLPYIFPGKVNCDVCHGGASGAYAHAGKQPVLAFGSHPSVVTGPSLRALLQKGWIAAPKELLARLEAQTTFLTPASGGGELKEVASAGNQVLALFQNNCLSCHNSAPLAAARQTGFVLSPLRRYTLEELRSALSGRSRVMGSLGKPLLAPGKPEESELVLRLRGQHARRRMPPAEGGVPETDEEVAEIVARWIASL